MDKIDGVSVSYETRWPLPQQVVYASVTILDTGEVFRCHPRESVLENLRRTGRRGIPIGCRSGGCSVCKVEILSGEYDLIRPMSREFVSDDDIAQGRVLSCCIRARGDMTVKVIGKLQKAMRLPCLNAQRKKEF